MSQEGFFRRIEADLKNRWIEESMLINETYSASDMLGNRVGMQPHKFGLVVWDWNDEYKKQLKRMKLKKGITSYEDDPLKYKEWLNSNTYKSFYGIPFQYIEQIPVWNKSAQWNDLGDIMGRFESQSIYGNSQAQDLTVSLTYLAENGKNSGLTSEIGYIKDTTWTLNAIERFSLQIKSLVFPQYDGKFAPPVKVLLNIGNIFVDFPVVIKNVTVEETNPFEITTMRAMMKKITIEMKSSYPAWQAISATQVWTADTGAVFGRQELQYIS